MTISLDHAHALNHLSDIAHFEERLVVHRAGLVFGLDFLSIHKDFDRNTNCLEQVPFSSPYFTIKTVSTTRLDTDESVTWKLHLEPTTPFLIFKQFVMNLQHDPDAEREVKRRNEKNENVGIDVRSPERRLSGRMLPAKLDKTLADWNMNYDPATKKAKTSKIEFIEGKEFEGAATCTECYAYASGKLVSNVKFCIDIFISGTANYRYDTSTTTFTTQNVALTALPDCVAMGTIGSATSSTYGNAGYDKPSPNNLMVGLEAEAYIEGAIGMNFLFSSIGISASKTVADFVVLKDTELSPVTISISGFPISITPTIGLYAKKFAASGKVEGKLEFGAGFDITAKLGGKLSYPSFFKATPSFVTYTGIVPTGVDLTALNKPTWTTYKDFTMKTSTTPFKLTNFKASVNINCHLQPKILLSIYAAIPILILPVVKADVTLSTTARRLEHDTSTSPSYHNTALRRLQTCASGATSYGSKGGVDLSIDVNKGTGFGTLVNGIFKSMTPNPLASITGATGLIDGITTEVVPKVEVLPNAAVVPEFVLVPAGCTDKSGTVVTAAVAAPVAAAGGGGGGGGGDSKSATAALDGGAIAGIVIGSLALVAMIVFYYYLAFVAKGPIRCCCVVCLPVHPNPNANMDHSIQKIDPTTQHNPVLAIRNAASAATTAIHKATHHGPPPHSSHAHTPAPAPAPAEAAAPAPAPAPASAPPSKKGPPPKKGLSEAEIKAAAEEDAKKRAKKDFDADHLPPGWEWEEHDGEVFYTMPNGETTWDDPRHDWEIFWKEYLPKK
jgi:hypothetical protein